MADAKRGLLTHLKSYYITHRNNLSYYVNCCRNQIISIKFNIFIVFLILIQTNLIKKKWNITIRNFLIRIHEEITCTNWLM